MFMTYFQRKWDGSVPTILGEALWDLQLTAVAVEKVPPHEGPVLDDRFKEGRRGGECNDFRPFALFHPWCLVAEDVMLDSVVCVVHFFRC
jgi:hypothetical protein